MSRQNQSSSQNTPDSTNDLDSAIRWTEKIRDSFQHIPLLDGIVLESEVEVFPGVHLVPFPPSLGKRGKEIPRYISEWASTVGIDYFFHKTQLIIDSSASSKFDSERFCQALSLACNSAVQIATFVSVKKNDEPFHLIPYGGSTVSHLPRSATKNSDVEEVKRLYERLGQLPVDVQQKLHIPINRWIKSYTKQGTVDKMIDLEVPPEKVANSPTTSDVDKMIDLGIAFESLYLSGHKNLSRKFRRRASWFLKKNEAHRKTLKEKFKKVYNLRCDAVHKGKLPSDVEICGKSVPILEFIEKAQGLCQQSILKIIENGQFPDWAKIHIPDC